MQDSVRRGELILGSVRHDDLVGAAQHPSATNMLLLFAQLVL